MHPGLFIGVRAPMVPPAVGLTPVVRPQQRRKLALSVLSAAGIGKVTVVVVAVVGPLQPANT
jgi:hypothetical protein